MLPFFRRVVWLEGVSLLVLLFVAMPLKYGLGMPLAVRIVGMLHGLLFMLYVVLLVRFGFERQWDARRLLIGFVASSIPFGTFWFDRHYLETERPADVSAASPGQVGSDARENRVAHSKDEMHGA